MSTHELHDIGGVQVWLPLGSKLPWKPGSQSRLIVEWLFRYGSIEDHQCREHCGYCTTLRSRVPELRIDLEPMGYTISDPDKDERNWRKNKTNSGKHRVYRLLRVEKQLDIFNDPWGREALRRNGGVA